jgi:uncharacterized membrane protein (DUF4010 family)
MCLRVLVASAVLNLPVSTALVPYLVAPFLAAALIAWWGLRKHQDAASVAEVPSNPLQFTSALQMAVLFQVVLFAVHWAQGMWGETGVFLSAGVLGLTDVDALVVSMVKDAGAQLPITAAARAITIGVLANTFLKLSIGVLIGAKQFRRIVLLGLLAIALACAASLAWLR